MVTASTLFPEEHASLSDGTTTVKFIFTDGDGNVNPLAFQASPYPRTALKTSTGESKYSDLEPPYFAIAQDDWTGGRGNEDFESDTSRYYDGHWVDTSKESGVVLGGRETYSTGYRNAEASMPGSVTFQGVYDATRYLAVSFAASDTYTSYQCEVWVKKIGTPTASLQVELWDDSASAPNSMLASKTLAPANITTDTPSLLQEFVWTGSPGLAGTTTYWLVIDGGTATSTNHWAIGVDAATAGKKSSDGSSWSATTYSPYYRITPTAADFVGKFFEYKRGFYMVTQPDAGGNSALYINGDRGTADANSGTGPNSEAAKTYLIDATKAWTNDEWIGCIVLITKGNGSEEIQPWREITDSYATTLVVSPSWNVTHDTTTEYVILGSDKWTSLVADLGDFVTDVVVADEFIYFIRGEESGSYLIKYRYYTSGGAWTTFNSAETVENAQGGLPILTGEGHNVLYLSHNDLAEAGVAITKSWVPRAGQNTSLYNDQGQMFSQVSNWNDRTVPYVTQGEHNGSAYFSISSSHNPTTYPVIGVKNLDPPVDISRSNAIKMLIKSSAATIATDMDILIDDVADLGQTRSPVKVFQADYTYGDQPSKVYHLDEEGASPTYTDLTNTYDGIDENFESVTIETDDKILIGYSIPFRHVYVDVGTVNDVAAALSVSYWDGSNDVSVDNLSDATKVNGDSFKQDGTVTWDLPADWKEQTINGVSAYWIWFTWDANLTAPITINRFALQINHTATMTPLYTDLTNTYDGDSATKENMKLPTEDYLYIGHGTKFNKISVEIGTANDIASVMTGAYWNGSAWTAVDIVDGTDVGGDTLKKTATVGDITFTIPNEADWKTCAVNGTTTYWFRLDVSVDLSTVFSIEEITVTRQNNITFSLPALAANTWTWVTLSISGWSTSEPDRTSIASIGIELDADKGAQEIWIKDVRLASSCFTESQIFPLPSAYRINGMEAYSGNVDDPVENPWIFTEKGVYELQTQNDDQVVPIPLKELSTLQSSENGLGHTVNGTYLYFNIGEKIERYFNRTLDDVGPDRDEGLPSDRPGIPKCLVSYPGRVYAAIDAGTDGTSSVLALDGTAWHEVYRAPRSGLRIRKLYAQAIPGTNVDRLWISMGSDILWVPISLNPYNETDYTFTHEGHLITSYIHANLKDVAKLWKSLKIFAENVTATRNIVADYQTDGGTSWTEIGTFDTVPVEEIDIASTLPQAKRIRFRLRFITADQTETPRLKAMVTEGVAFVPVKNQYSWTFAIQQTTENIDLFGKYDSTLTSLQEYDKLRDWANDGNPLTFRCNSTLHDNKTVFLNPISVSPILVVDHEGIENHVATITCIQV
jgi:hypothetical protein